MRLFDKVEVGDSVHIIYVGDRVLSTTDRRRRAFEVELNRELGAVARRAGGMEKPSDLEVGARELAEAIRDLADAVRRLAERT